MTDRVVIVEDDAGMRVALEAALALRGFTVLGAFDRGEDALAADATADVAIVDLGLPGLSGVDTIRRLKSARPVLAVLVLTVFETPALIVEAIAAGASGYLLKGTSLDEIARAVREVEQGLAPVSPTVARHLLSTIRARSEQMPSTTPLSEREVEVLSLLVNGDTYAFIAAALGIQQSTVQTRVKSVYQNLAVSSKADAATVAARGRPLGAP